VNFRWTALAAAQRIRNLIFDGIRTEAVGNLKMKNGRKTAKGGQCRWKRSPNPSCCPLLWDLTERKQYHNEENHQNSWSAGIDPLENPSGKEHGTSLDLRRALHWGLHLHQLLDSWSGDGGRADFYKRKKIRSPTKGQLGEPLPAITGQPIGTRSSTTDGSGKMAKHPRGEKEALNF